MLPSPSPMNSVYGLPTPTFDNDYPDDPWPSAWPAFRHMTPPPSPLSSPSFTTDRWHSCPGHYNSCELCPYLPPPTFPAPPDLIIPLSKKLYLIDPPSHPSASPTTLRQEPDTVSEAHLSKSEFIEAATKDVVTWMESLLVSAVDLTEVMLT